jgi:hypothetical protein
MAHLGHTTSDDPPEKRHVSQHERSQLTGEQALHLRRSSAQRNDARAVRIDKLQTSPVQTIPRNHGAGASASAPLSFKAYLGDLPLSS